MHHLKFGMISQRHHISMPLMCGIREYTVKSVFTGFLVEGAVDPV